MSRTKLTKEEAIAMLPDGDTIHTFRSSPMMLVGADWGREEIIKAIEKYGAELSGEQATKLHHGIVTEDKRGHLFIETKDNA